MKPIRVAIAGLGRSGYNIHVKAFNGMRDNFAVVAAADQLPERRRDVERDFEAKTYDDWLPMLEAGGFDLLVNALPTPHHPSVTTLALEHGAHVVCEKPMAKTVTDFDTMVETAKRNDVNLFGFQNNRLQPFFDKIREVVASGVLGKIVHIRSNWGSFRRRWDWQTLQEMWGGTLLNTGPHAIDQALALYGFDRKPPEVFCRLDSNNAFAGDADDHCTLTLYDPDREAPQIEILISQYVHFPQGGMYHINGTRGGLVGGADHLSWRYFDPEKAPEQQMWTWSVDRKYPTEDLDWIEESWILDEQLAERAVGYTLKSLKTGPVKFYENLYEVVSGDAEPLINLGEVRMQIEIIEKAMAQNPLPKKSTPAN